tara:strand:+ start:384 stop:1862 length:1479 start_codon:yes stop_codon:yes gene_type:complete
MIKPNYFTSFPRHIQREERPEAGGVGEKWSQIGTETIPPVPVAADPPPAEIAEPISDGPGAEPNPPADPPPAELPTDPPPAEPLANDPPPVEVQLPAESVTAIEAQMKAQHPNATPEELETFTNSAKDDALSEFKDDVRLNGMYEDKMAEIKAIAGNENLTEDQLREAARPAVEADLAGKGIFDSMVPKDGDPAATNIEFDWATASKDIYVNNEPLNVEENSVDAINTAIEERLSIVKGENEAYNGLDDEAKRVAQFVAANGIHKLDEYVHPDKGLETIMAYSPEDKMALWIKQDHGDEATNEEDVAQEILEMKENVLNASTGMTEFEQRLGTIDRGLRSNHRAAQEHVLHRNEQAFEQAQAKETASNEAIVNSVRAEFDNIKDFGVDPVPKALTDNLKESFNETQLKRMSTDPANLAKAYLFDKFGKDYVKGVQNKAFLLGKNKGFSTSANIPLQDSKTRVAPPAAPEASLEAKGFSGWQKSLENLQSQPE